MAFRDIDSTRYILCPHCRKRVDIESKIKKVVAEVSVKVKPPFRLSRG